ncbi:MAG: BamA/TamA family outer membrane protein [Vicinamibacterales bacterium]|jgi:hypothetical protein
MFRGTAALLLSTLLSTPAAAQSTRVETIADQQAEKAKRLGEEGPSDAERVIRRILISPLLSGGDGVYPWFGSVFGGAGMAAGAGYLKRLEKAAAINLLAGVSVNGSTLFETRLAAPELWHGMLRVDVGAQRLEARGVSFYGLGPSSNQDARVRYHYQPTEAGGNAALTPAKWLAFQGGYSFVSLDTTSDGPGSLANAGPGLGEGLRYHVVRAGAAIDWRTSPGYSTRGGFYRATWERHREMNDRPFSFDSQEYEVVQLVPLLREQFVLAGRGVVTLTNTDAGHQVPVMLAPFLGSGSTLRSFANRRFTDRNRVLLTGEYRWRPSRYLDMAIFLDAGQVAADRKQFRAGDLETSWGLGARFHGPLFTALRVEVARGREGLGLIFAGSQIF